VSFQFFEVEEAKVALVAPFMVMICSDCCANVYFELFWKIESLFTAVGVVEAVEGGRIEFDQDRFIGCVGLFDVGVEVQ